MKKLAALAIRNSDYRDYEERPPQKMANQQIQEVNGEQRPAGWNKVEEEDRINAVKLLIGSGADMHIRKRRGESALDLERKYSKNPECVHHLANAAAKKKP